MGGGSWSCSVFDDYTRASKGMSSTAYTTAANLSTQDIFKNYSLDEMLNPKNVMRECCDSEEHPNTLPVILALDVTGSMGSAATKTAQTLNDIMTHLYEAEMDDDIEFCIMGIGDLAYDRSPIQISQFESDIRIAEQVDKVFFEFGGGGNKFESYTAAWYMGSRHCQLDCNKRGKKGIIITMGDELPNPYLPKEQLSRITGDTLQSDIDTKELYEEVCEKFDIYHISIDDSDSSYKFFKRNYDIDLEWRKYLEDNYKVSTLNKLEETIVDIIINRDKNKPSTVFLEEKGESKVSW